MCVCYITFDSSRASVTDSGCTSATIHVVWDLSHVIVRYNQVGANKVKPRYLPYTLKAFAWKQAMSCVNCEEIFSRIYIDVCSSALCCLCLSHPPVRSLKAPVDRSSGMPRLISPLKHRYSRHFRGVFLHTPEDIAWKMLPKFASF